MKSNNWKINLLFFVWIIGGSSILLMFGCGTHYGKPKMDLTVSRQTGIPCVYFKDSAFRKDGTFLRKCKECGKVFTMRGDKVVSYPK